MAVIRQGNWLSQQRVDVQHLRSIESAVAGDFDVLVGRAMAGSKALVVRGLHLAGVSNLVSAKAMSIVVADGLVFNLNADESGSFLWIPDSTDPVVLDPDTNAEIDGGWTPSTTNYVGLSFIREADSGTADLVQFRAANTGLEVPKQVPLAKTLNFRLSISTLPFSAQPNLVPIARVTLDSSSRVTAIKDARPLMFRLGSGGDNPDSASTYANWTRSEVLDSITTAEFQGGDKSIRSLKDWQDAVMTRLWEIGGGEFWYSATSDRNVRLITHDDPGVSGEYFVWDSGTEELTWQNLRVVFDNSTVYSNDIEDGTMTSFSAGECLYVDLDRTQFYAPAWVILTAYVKGDLVVNGDKAYECTVAGTSAGAGGPTGTGTAIVDASVTWKYVGPGVAGGLVPQKASLQDLGVGAPPGSRFVLAWRQSDEVFTRDWRYPLGTLFPPATASTIGSVKLSRTASTPAAPIVISDTGGTIAAPDNATVALALKAFTAGVDILQWRSGADALLGSISNDGDIVFADNRYILWPNFSFTQDDADDFSLRGGALYGVRLNFHAEEGVSGKIAVSADGLGVTEMGVLASANSFVGAYGAVDLEFHTNLTARWKITATGILTSVGGNRAIQGVLDPVGAQDAATKKYVDDTITANTKIAVTGGIGFTGTWADTGAGYDTVKYWKDALGFVHLEGSMGGGAAAPAFTLPVGYRPTGSRVFAIAIDATVGRLGISSAGVVSCTDGIGAATVSLDGISFLP